MKKLKQVAVVLLFCAAGVAVIVGVVALSSGYLDDKSSQAKPKCSGGANHKVVIQNDRAMPSHVTAPLCDTLTITNLDSTERFMAFGPHEDHVPYDDVTAKDLTRGQGFTVTLVQAGNFRFHDHFHDEVQGTFSVTRR